MTKPTWRAATLVLALGLAGGPAAAWDRHDDLVDVEVVSDYGRRYASYPVRSSGDVERAYIEAREGERYSIRVRNRSGERIGLVVAVDGRNIISGKKSHLKSKERMYILGPWQEATYRGWRTGRDRVNRFYFTDVGDSYADAFGDRSAMGVIAVAAFGEKYRRAHRYRDNDRFAGKSAPSARSGGKSGAAPQGKRGHADAREEAEPGTGFGEERYSPAVRVAFDAERRPLEKHFLKYEWRETLCEMGVADCWRKHRRNRFWDRRHDDSYGFAPYPPRRRWYARQHD